MFALVGSDQLNTAGIVRAKLVDVYTQVSNTTNSVTIQFSGLSAGTYFLKVDQMIVRSGGTIELSVDGVDISGSTSYTFFDETGTKVSGADTIELADNSSLVRPTGIVTVQHPDNLVSIDNQLGFAESTNLNGFAQKGRLDDAESSLSSIEIIISSITSGHTIRLWEGL